VPESQAKRQVAERYHYTLAAWQGLSAPLRWRFANRMAAVAVPANLHESRLPVPRRVKDFIDISEYTTLDDLIRYLKTIRENLPDGHDAELKIRGDDVFGRRLTITYFREQNSDEAELEAKYLGETPDDPGIEQLTRKLEDVPYEQEPGDHRKDGNSG
jgi:hypothetical protein